MGKEQFPDKKVAITDYDRVTGFINEAAALSTEFDVSQEHATFMAWGDYPELPICFEFFTDVHYGSLATRYDLLNEHLSILEETPNFFSIWGGDDTDAFSPSKHPVGMLGDAITPQMQAQAFGSKLLELDRKGKIALIQGGNHTDWIDTAGYDFSQTFYEDMQAPIFRAGGVLEIVVAGQQSYRVGVNHTHWGNSKLNPTNAAKRAMEFSYPGTDIVLLGHTHQAAGEMFDRGGEQKIAVIGGTFKLDDIYGKKWGMGHAGKPGYTIMLWPNQKRMELFRDPIIAQHYLLTSIAEFENGQGEVSEE